MAAKDKATEVYYNHLLDDHNYTLANALIYINRMIRDTNDDLKLFWIEIKNEIQNINK